MEERETNRMIIISKSPTHVSYLVDSYLGLESHLGQFDHSNQIITLPVMTLNGLYCGILHSIVTSMYSIKKAIGERLAKNLPNY